MADIAIQTNGKVLIGDKILVTVDSIIPDIIVVSFVNGIKTFQGALLNVNQRALPCGIHSPKSIMDQNEDELATLSARVTYLQEKNYTMLSSSSSSTPPNFDSGKTIDAMLKMRKPCRPTVRLRPRQVLCNKCQSICNEQNENIGVGRKRKKCEDISVEQNIKSRTTGPMSRRSERASAIQQQSEKNGINGRIDDPSPLISGTSQVHSTENHDGNQMNRFEKNIRLCWLRSATIRESLRSRSLNKCPNAIRSHVSIPLSNYHNSSTVASPESISDVMTSAKKTLAAADSTIKNTLRTSKMQRTSRKQRSVGSIEDLWEGNIFEDIIKSNHTTQVTPVIKILLGTHGEATMLKIPSTMKKSPKNMNQNHDRSTDYGEKSDRPLVINGSLSAGTISNTKSMISQIDGQRFLCKDVACAKATRRALKKAKKEARRKMVSSSGDVPPTNALSRCNATCDTLLHHRRRHKVKHKNKHKNEHEHHEIQLMAKDLGDESMTKCITTTNSQQRIFNGAYGVIPDGESYTAIKEQCLKQKLSISLKRLNPDAYTRCDYPVSDASSRCKSSDISSEKLSELDQEKSLVDNVETDDDASNSSQSHSLEIRIATTPVAYCFTATGKRMDVGDIVWGKIHGFPWWPGKVLSISVSAVGDGSSDGAQAHVAWYGSSTCSLMSCDQLSPFLETFKTRYNKKKRGPYKEAIRQAQSEAQTLMPIESAHENVASFCESPRG